MSTPSKTTPGGATGHYGTGYGERAPRDETPSLTLPADDLTAPAGLEPIDRRLDPNAPAATTEVAAVTTGDSVAATDDVDPATNATSAGTDAPVVFTPADVHARPPDRPPTDAAPESEKAGLVFERS
jgi:hypothetical protein